MFITRSEDVPAEKLDLGGAEGSSIRWLIGPAQGADNFSMRLVTVAPGGRTPEHAHCWEHQWYVLAGAGQAVDADGNSHPVGPGSVVYVPEDETHNLRNTGSDPLELICMIRCTPESAPGCRAPNTCG
jgi:quercetin dioxygenase-like cupin family protein